MWNILLAMAVGLLTWAGLALTNLLRPGEAAVPAVLLAGLGLWLLARRTYRRLEDIFAESSRVLQGVPPRFDLGVAVLERAYPLGRWQLGVSSQVDAQIGVLLFLRKSFGRALPHLKRALLFGHWMAGAMLAVAYYKKRDEAQMRRTLLVVSRRAKKQGLVWNLYAYLLLQVGDRAMAQRVLVEGSKHAADDPRVRENLLALQNGKKLKMRAYQEQWYQFHLEAPPTQHVQGAGSPRVGRIARRGRWS